MSRFWVFIVSSLFVVSSLPAAAQAVQAPQSGDALQLREASTRSQRSIRQLPRQVPDAGVDSGALTPAEKAGEKALERMLSRSFEGLVEVQHANGMVSVDLGGRFMHVMVLIASEGGLTTECHSSLASLKKATSAVPEGSILRRPVAPTVPTTNDALEVQ